MARRILSVVLFVIAGWILASGLMVAWMSFGQGLGIRLGVAGVMAAFSLPFLLLGTWASPGQRLPELGLTLMIAAGVGAALGLMMMLFMNDPSFVRLMPPNPKLAALKFAPISGGMVALALGGIGWVLFSRGKAGAGSTPG